MYTHRIVKKLSKMKLVLYNTLLSPLLYLFTGDHDLNATDGYEQNIPIDKIFRHPQYTSNLRRGTRDYDVALVKLQSPLTYNNRVRPVCLPQVNFSANTNCYVTGWDSFSEEGSSPQVIKIKKRI